MNGEKEQMRQHIMPNTRILRTNTSFRTLWLARAISFVGSNATTTALVLFVATRYGAGAVAVTLIAQSLPRLFGPIAGTLADRVEPRTLMICCDLLSAVFTLVVILALGSLPWLLVFVMLSNTTGAAFSVTARGSLPGIVPGGELPEANAWLINAFMLQGAVGPVLGSALYASVGVSAALVADAASFLISAALLSRLPRLSAKHSGARQTFLEDLRSGARTVRTSPLLRWLFLLTSCAIFFGSFDNVALVFLARSTFRAGSLGYGALFSCFAVGTIVAALALTSAPARTATARVLLVGTAAGGIGALGTGLAPLIAVAAAAQLVVGLSGGVLGVAQETMMQTVVAREYLGRVAGFSFALTFLVSSAGYLAGGRILDWSGPRVAFISGGAGTLVMSLVLFPVLASQWRRVCADSESRVADG